MNYAEIKKCDIANGVGVRTTLFVSGCRHHCPACFNPSAWSFEAGTHFGQDVADDILASLAPPYVTGLSVLGGEPLEAENQEALAPFLELVRDRLPEKTIWLWTGFVYEELADDGCRARTPWLERILGSIDVMVDGPFVQAEADMLLRFRGSSNQRIIDVPASRLAGKVVLWEDEAVFSSHSW